MNCLLPALLAYTHQPRDFLHHKTFSWYSMERMHEQRLKIELSRCLVTKAKINWLLCSVHKKKFPPIYPFSPSCERAGRKMKHYFHLGAFFIWLNGDTEEFLQKVSSLFHKKTFTFSSKSSPLPEQRDTLYSISLLKWTISVTPPDSCGLMEDDKERFLQWKRPQQSLTQNSLGR